MPAKIRHTATSQRVQNLLAAGVLEQAPLAPTSAWGTFTEHVNILLAGHNLGGEWEWDGEDQTFRADLEYWCEVEDSLGSGVALQWRYPATFDPKKNLLEEVTRLVAEVDEIRRRVRIFAAGGRHALGEPLLQMVLGVT